MPAASWRMNPARTSSWWLVTCASAGVSLRVGTNEREVRMAGPYLITAAPWKSVGPPYRRPLSFPLERALDGVLELFVGDRAIDEDAVHEERRSSGHARFLPGLLVGLDQRPLLAPVQAFVEPRAVQAQVLGVALQVVDGELLLVGEHAVVQLPELLVACVGGLLGEVVEVEREMAEDQAHPAVVLLHQPLHDRVLAPAVRTLEVGELHDGDRRVLRTAGGSGGGHLDAGQVRLGEGELEAALRLQVVHHLGQLLAPLLLLEVGGDAVLDLVVGLAAHLGLVLLVELLLLFVAGGSDHAEQLLVEPLLQRLALRLGLVLEEPLGHVLIHGVAPDVVQLGQRLDLGLEELSALLLLDLAIGDRLAVDLRNDLVGTHGKRALLRLRARLAGAGRQEKCHDRPPTLALHDALRKGKTRTLGRASTHVNHRRCGRLPSRSLRPAGEAGGRTRCSRPARRPRRCRAAARRGTPARSRSRAGAGRSPGRPSPRLRPPPPRPGCAPGGGSSPRCGGSSRPSPWSARSSSRS